MQKEGNVCSPPIAGIEDDEIGLINHC